MARRGLHGGSDEGRCRAGGLAMLQHWPMPALRPSPATSADCAASLPHLAAAAAVVLLPPLPALCLSVQPALPLFFSAMISVSAADVRLRTLRPCLCCREPSRTCRSSCDMAEDSTTCTTGTATCETQQPETTGSQTAASVTARGRQDGLCDRQETGCAALPAPSLCVSWLLEALRLQAVCSR